MAIIVTIAAVGQIILAFLLYNQNGNEIVINIGWMILWISAIFGWLPILTLKKWGEVPKGKSYMSTVKLVDRGVYAIVRHPQYLAGILMGVALPLISQHWAVAVLGCVAIIVYYIDTFEEEKSCTEKFGDEYREYMKRVPRINFILGMIRLAANRLKA
jgi:protein-S-isoprenylcysteine O-methyltransferase Ste14